jgi:hypothetical protein
MFFLESSNTEETGNKLFVLGGWGLKKVSVALRDMNGEIGFGMRSYCLNPGPSLDGIILASQEPRHGVGEGVQQKPRLMEDIAFL